jgi:hypothetical protein
LFNASPTATIANPTTANLFKLHNYHSPFINHKDLGDRGRSEEKGFHAVNSKQKSTKNSFLVALFGRWAFPMPNNSNKIFES